MSKNAKNALYAIEETMRVNKARPTMADISNMMTVIEKTADEADFNPSYMPTALQVIRHFAALVLDEHSDMDAVFERIAYHVDKGLAAPEAVEGTEDDLE